MELNLNRVDYIQVDVTSRKCAKLLPAAEPKACQKVVVASHSGVVHCFGMKKGEVQTVFKTLPGNKVTRVELGGSFGSVQDKIFVAAGNEVYGFTKKGKQFLRFDTNITDTITSLCVCGNNLMVCSDYVYNHYLDCQDTNYYLSGDKINDMIVLPLARVKALIPVLACQDRVLRVLKDSQCQLEIEVPGPALTLALHQNDGGASGSEIVYGTSDGRLGLISIENMQATTIWELYDSERQGGITCIDSYDITGDGVKDLIVGRNDGEIEVYGYNDCDEPVLRFSYNCGESVTSVQGGVVGVAGYDEILVTTYSGWVMGLSTEHLEKRLDPSYLLISPEAAQRILKLRRGRASTLDAHLVARCYSFRFHSFSLGGGRRTGTESHARKRKIPAVDLLGERGAVCHPVLRDQRLFCPQPRRCILHSLHRSADGHRHRRASERRPRRHSRQREELRRRELQPVRAPERKLPAGDVPMPGEHDALGSEDPVHRRTVWDTEGLRSSTPAAQVLPSKRVPDKTSLAAQKNAHGAR